MTQVMAFLKAYVKEKSEADPNNSLIHDTIGSATAASVVTVSTSDIFVWPKNVSKTQTPKFGRIQYSEPNEKIDKVKKALKVTTLRDVGEKTFEYFYSAEVDD